MNTGREYTQLQRNEWLLYPDEFYADVAIGNAGVVFGRRMAQNGTRNPREAFADIMSYWGGYFWR